MFRKLLSQERFQEFGWSPATPVATWLMNILTASPFLLSSMSDVAALSFFLFKLPAGALAGRVDRCASASRTSS